MSRLVVVSNRAPDLKQTVATGGLAIGVLGAPEYTGGLWLGWNGELVEHPPDAAELRSRRGVTFAISSTHPLSSAVLACVLLFASE